MSVKIPQRFRVTDGIGVEDGQRSMGERGELRRRGEDDKVVAGGWLGQRVAAGGGR
jgi:hypothetical protein